LDALSQLYEPMTGARADDDVVESQVLVDTPNGALVD
jgi:hypothetical protein